MALLSGKKIINDKEDSWTSSYRNVCFEIIVDALTSNLIQTVSKSIT